MKGREFKIVVMDSPHETLVSSKDAQKYIGQYLAARINGYKSNYGESVFPYGVEDFVANHIAVCELIDNELIPIVTHKMISLRDCERYDIEFPLLHTLEKYPEISTKVKNQIQKSKESGKNIGYIGSLTRNKNYSFKDVPDLKNLMSLSFIKSSEYYGIDEFLVTGSIPNGSYRYIQYMGFENLCEESVLVKDICNVESYVQYMRAWSDQARKDCAYLQQLWENRIHFKAESYKVRSNDIAVAA